MAALTIDLGDDDGWFLAKVRTDGGETDIRLDLYQACHQYAAFCAQFGADETALGDALVAWLMGNGVPKLTHAGAFRLAHEVNKQTLAHRATHYPPKE